MSQAQIITNLLEFDLKIQLLQIISNLYMSKNNNYGYANTKIVIFTVNVKRKM